MAARPELLLPRPRQRERPTIVALKGNGMEVEHKTPRQQCFEHPQAERFSGATSSKKSLAVD